MNIKTCKLADLVKTLDTPIDVFISCASFEIRCRSVADILKGMKIKHILIAYNTNLSNYVGDNLNYLQNIFNEHAKKVPINSGNALKTADELDSALRYIPYERYHYLIDITTFTHESLLMLFKLLNDQKKGKNKITFIYTGATEYSIDQQKPEKKWLSKGISNIRSVLGYPGEVLPSRKDHLIILVGYEHERASILIEKFEPNMISLGYGKAGSDISEHIQKANVHFHKLAEQIATRYSASGNFEFSCNDPCNARDEILKCVQKTPDYNHIIAPMNTKISTIGSALAALEDPSIQLCFAQPSHYNYKHYSSPGDTCYLIDFQDLFKKE